MIKLIDVQTILKESKIQGIGLFANEYISKGTVVWSFNELTTISWDDEEWVKIRESLSSNAFSNIERFAYYEDSKWHLNLDDSRFMNHSKSPTLGYSKAFRLCYALRDIKNGEELTTDYSEFCETSDTATCIECGLCIEK